MTTYQTPHFATGPSVNAPRSEPTFNRTRPASAAPYRTAGVTNEAALMADGQTPDWQPGVSKGVPKAAIGALGAALVGGVALAIVLMAPSNKVVKQAQPDPIAQATAQNADAQRTVASADAAVNDLEKNPPAAGATTAAQPTVPEAAPAATATAAPAVPPVVQGATPEARPVANAPVAHAARQPAPARPAAAPQAERTAPAATPDAPAQAPAPVVTPPADVQAPATQQTPDTPTVTPTEPTPAPAQTPDTGNAPTPAPSE